LILDKFRHRVTNVGAKINDELGVDERVLPVVRKNTIRLADYFYV
jgi:hypothetical protein